MYFIGPSSSHTKAVLVDQSRDGTEFLFPKYQCLYFSVIQRTTS